MRLTVDPTITDSDTWATDPSTVDDWLFAMWGIVPGTSCRPARPSGRVHPSSAATAGWLKALFGSGI